jgi:hypothetical protein
LDEPLRVALDQIHAEPELKDRTMAYLQAQMRKRQKLARSAFRFATVMAAIAMFALSSLFSVRLYAAPSAYVDLDVNPSIELTLNHFGRVLSARGYNDDGTALLREMNLRHKPCANAAQELLEAMIDRGYLTDSLVTFTVQGDREEHLAAGLRDAVDAVLSRHHAAADVEVSVVSPEVKAQAHDHCVSPATYLAIQELRVDDPSITFEDCAGHSLSELRERVGHGAKHHAPPKAGNNLQPHDQNGHGGDGQHHGQGHGENE